MKRFLALALAAVLVMGLASCGKQSATQSGQSSGSSSHSSSTNKNNSGQSGGSSGSQSSSSKNDSAKKVATAAQLVAALEKAGYMVEEQISVSDSEFGNDVTEARRFEFARYMGEIGPDEVGFVIYLCLSSEDAAAAMYMSCKNDNSDEYVFDELSEQNFAKATAVAEFGKAAEYGETYIISRIKNTLIILRTDWDDYQDSDTPYDHAAQKALESLGY